MEGDASTPRGRVVIGGALDRRRAEALGLEIRALAREYGLDVADLTVVCGDAPPEGEATAEPRT